jgi:hypothetical protein
MTRSAGVTRCEKGSVGKAQSHVGHIAFALTLGYDNEGHLGLYSRGVIEGVPSIRL